MGMYIFNFLFDFNSSCYYLVSMVAVFDVKFSTMDLATNSMAKPMKVKTL